MSTTIPSMIRDLVPEPAWARAFLVVAALGALAGAIWGGVRGASYPPTLPFAVVEGAVLIGVPTLALAAVVALGVALATRTTRSSSR